MLIHRSELMIRSALSNHCTKNHFNNLLFYFSGCLVRSLVYSFLVSFGYDVKGDDWSSVNDDIAVVNEPLHELKKNKIVCHLSC